MRSPEDPDPRARRLREDVLRAEADVQAHKQRRSEEENLHAVAGQRFDLGVEEFKKLPKDIAGAIPRLYQSIIHLNKRSSSRPPFSFGVLAQRLGRMHIVGRIWFCLFLSAFLILGLSITGAGAMALMHGGVLAGPSGKRIFGGLDEALIAMVLAGPFFTGLPLLVLWDLGRTPAASGHPMIGVENVRFVIENAIHLPGKPGVSARVLLGDLIFTDTMIEFVSLAPVLFPSDLTGKFMDVVAFGIVGGAVKSWFQNDAAVQDAESEAKTERRKQFASGAPSSLVSMPNDRSQLRYSEQITNATLTVTVDGTGEFTFSFRRPEQDTLLKVQSWPRSKAPNSNGL